MPPSAGVGLPDGVERVLWVVVRSVVVTMVVVLVIVVCKDEDEDGDDDTVFVLVTVGTVVGDRVVTKELVGTVNRLSVEIEVAMLAEDIAIDVGDSVEIGIKKVEVSIIESEGVVGKAMNVDVAVGKAEGVPVVGSIVNVTGVSTNDLVVAVGKAEGVLVGRIVNVTGAEGGVAVTVLVSTNDLVVAGVVMRGGLVVVSSGGLVVVSSGGGIVDGMKTVPVLELMMSINDGGVVTLRVAVLGGDVKIDE